MVRDAGHVTPRAAAELISMYMDAVKQGADVILNICSSVGEVADGVPRHHLIWGSGGKD